MSKSLDKARMSRLADKHRKQEEEQKKKEEIKNK